MKRILCLLFGCKTDVFGCSRCLCDRDSGDFVTEEPWRVLCVALTIAALIVVLGVLFVEWFVKR